MKALKQKVSIGILITGLGFFLFALNDAFVSFAQTAPPPYVLISPLPGASEINLSDPAGYFNLAFQILVGLAGLLAVIMVAYGGFMYMGSDSYSSKSEAKSIISSSIIGLLLLLGSYLFLYTINPDLIKLTYFTDVGSRVKIGPTTPSGSTPSPGCQWSFTFKDATGNHLVAGFCTGADCQAEETRVEKICIASVCNKIITSCSRGI